ncbi:MAG: aminopeptidase [Clostridiales bacterium]|nr:aminopeptidase [Clostridiales bacterium]
MTDPRINTLAKNLVTFSCTVQKGENVLIETYGNCDDLLLALIREVYAAGGNPFVWRRDNEVQRAIAMGATEEQLKLMAENDGAFMEKMQAYIGIRALDNGLEMSDVPEVQRSRMNKLYSMPVHSGIRVPKTKWVVLRYPTRGAAWMAGMSTEAFEDYYFNVCCLDYSKMDKAMDALVELIGKTDKVHIVGPGTDLSFSVKGLGGVKCAGHLNIPDGEVFTAPVRDSVNGVIRYNTPSVSDGFTFENIELTFENGRIVKATANDTERINAIFDRDEGARYVGEFAIGVNPYINTPMKDTLFDEKIAGSFHFTPGSCYDECDNGNESCIHWDLVCIQTPEYGGGEMYFDGVLIRKDGRFVLPELEALNPENLK